jgi:hypothetical protein
MHRAALKSANIENEFATFPRTETKPDPHHATALVTRNAREGYPNQSPEAKPYPGRHARQVKRVSPLATGF